MCYTVVAYPKVKDITHDFPELLKDIQLLENTQLSNWIVGHQHPSVPVIYYHRTEHVLACRTMEWGIIPHYIKKAAQFADKRSSMLNARSEKIIGDTQSYWYTIRNRRCLVPVAGILEYRTVPGIKSKIPYYVYNKEQQPLYLPGLYAVAELIDENTGELIKLASFTLVTRKANSLLMAIHNSGTNAGRMPLFLPLNLAKTWLQEGLNAHDLQQLLAYEHPSEALNYHTVFPPKRIAALDNSNDFTNKFDYGIADLVL
ncbi:MAG: SOS response-associated peptidase [Chitinophagaceae bacterium]